MTALEHLADGPALNAYEFTFDPVLLDPLRLAYLRLDLDPLFAGGTVCRGKVTDRELAFHVEPYRRHLAWVSADDSPTHALFRRYFDALQLEASLRTLVDCERHVEMYSGFFVVADRFDDVFWHVDYVPGANAYTLLTPLFPLDSGHGHLLIADAAHDRVIQYRYELGRAILVGERLVHSTRPYSFTGTRRVLVSLTFGTDKMKYWPALSQTTATQSKFMIMPCGHERDATGWQRAAHEACLLRTLLE